MHTHQFFADKELFHKIRTIAIPIALQNLILFGISMADTVMVGKLGEIQLSAASIAYQVWFVLTLLMYGLSSGSNVLIAQFWGKGDVDSIHKSVTIMYRMLFGGALIFTLIAFFLPHQVMSIFTTDADVIAEGVRYLRILSFSFILGSFSGATLIMLRAVGSVRISLLVFSTSLVTNIFFNWLLIFGNLGAPALGIEGAAIATCIARLAEWVILFPYIAFFEHKIRYRIRHLFAVRLGIIKEYMACAGPVILNELMWGLGMAAISVIIGRMGREFTAANSVCTTLGLFVTITIMGVGNAAAVIVGNTVGAGQYQLAKSRARTLMIISFFLGLFSCALMLLLKGPMLSLYNLSDITKHYANQMMTIYSVIVIFQSLSMVGLIGVLRGGGDTRFVFIMDVAFMWIFSIPFGFLTGLGLHWGVPAVYVIIRVEELFKAVCAILRLRWGHWINDITQRPR